MIEVCDSMRVMPQAICSAHCLHLHKYELTDDSDREGAVGLVPGAVGRNVGDGFPSNGEQLGRGVHWLRLHAHLEEEEISKI